MKCRSYDLFFDSFSNRTRMKIIKALGCGPKSVNEICRSIGEEQSKVSHNLRKLSLCNFLEVKSRGKQRIYSLNRSTIVPILRIVEAHVGRFCRTCKKGRLK